MNLTFGEQVKIVLSRKGMTIKELAEKVEAYTGKPMSRQNMTQRLGRDNFQEQDMRMIAEILGCPFTLNIIDVQPEIQEVLEEPKAVPEHEPEKEEVTAPAPVKNEEQEMLRKGIKGYFKKTESRESKLEQAEIGEINPYTRKEYESNSVRMHPNKIGYVQVYDKERHKWMEMTEWAFLGYQDKRKQLLGKDYKPPIYLD